jgi:hypothetical protein
MAKNHQPRQLPTRRNIHAIRNLMPMNNGQEVLLILRTDIRMGKKDPECVVIIATVVAFGTSPPCPRKCGRQNRKSVEITIGLSADNRKITSSRFFSTLWIFDEKGGKLWKT